MNTSNVVDFVAEVDEFIAASPVLERHPPLAWFEYLLIRKQTTFRTELSKFCKKH